MAAPRKDNIKEKILQATTELLKTTALADISLAEIAAAAGISKGTLYYREQREGHQPEPAGAVCSGAGYCLCRTAPAAAGGSPAGQ